MKRPALLFVAGCLCVILGDATAQTTPDPASPVGRPEKFHGGKLTAYAVWQEDGTWHLRMSSVDKKKGDRVLFNGSVRADGDRMTAGAIQGLEKSKNNKTT